MRDFASGLFTSANPRQQVAVPWDADRYNDAIDAQPTGRNVKVEAVIDNDWGQATGAPMAICGACINVDCHGRIFAWSVAGALSKRRQVR